MVYRYPQTIAMNIGQETIQCSRCKKRFFEDGFKVSRLGRRNKTCLECNVRAKADAERNKCPHGRQRNLCRDCGGKSRCEHDRQRNSCRDCNPDGCRRANELGKFRTYQREGGWPIMPLVRKSTRDQCDYVAIKLAREFTKLLEEGRVTQAEYDALMTLRRHWTGPVENDDPQNLMTPFDRWGIPHGPSPVYALKAPPHPPANPLPPPLTDGSAKAPLAEQPTPTQAVAAPEPEIDFDAILSEVSGQALKYHFQVDVREGRPGFCDDATYTSNPYSTFAECYRACCYFRPESHWKHHRLTTSMTMRRGAGPLVKVRETATECGVIYVDDLPLLGITEEEFDHVVLNM